MAVEIERKFLIKDERWRNTLLGGKPMIQGYFENKHPTCRIRISGEDAWITLKGPTQGITRSEFEYAIPVLDARSLLDQFCGDRVIEKKRYEVKVGEHIWEIDEFLGRYKGLWIAEIELKNENVEFRRPDWLGKEVSGEPRYYNQVMANTIEKE